MLIICEYILEETLGLFATRENLEAFHVCQVGPSKLYK